MNVLSPENNIGEPRRFAPWGAEPGRLWSLWEIMKPFYADQFFNLGSRLKQFCGPFGDRLFIWFIFGRNPGNWFGLIKHQLAPKTRDWIFTLFLTLKEDCIELDLDNSRASLDRLLKLLEEPKVHWREVFKLSQSLKERLCDELKSKKFFYLTSLKAKFYEKPTDGWEDVAKKLPSAEYDIQEAAKCFALSRSTASAFHSIRCLEAGIRAVARSLNIPDPIKGSDRSWGKTLGVIKTEIDKRWPASSAGRMSGDGQFFDEFYGSLSGMQNPYRNATMHLDHKYTEDEAEQILIVVKGIMRKVASRMDEQGEPKA